MTSVARAPSPRLVTVAIVMLCCAAATAPWWPVYESPEFFAAAGLGILAGTVVAILGARLRWPSWTVIVVSFGAFLVLGVPVAVPGRALFGVLPTPGGLVDLVAGVALSWRRLVTISIPVGSYQALLVPLFLLAIGAAVVGVTLALRTSRPEAAILPPAVLLVTGIAFGAERPAIALPAGLVFLALAVGWLAHLALWRQRAVLARTPEAPRAGGGLRRGLGAAGMLVVALLVAGAAAAAMPAAARTVIRAEVRPPFEPQAQPSPLVGFRAAFEPPTAEQAMLEVQGLPEGDRLRVAVLDRYDGIVYSVGGDGEQSGSGEFTRVPYRLDQSDAPGSAVELDVSVAGYAGVWVPGVGRLEQLSFDGPNAARLDDGVFYDEATDTIAVDAGLGRGDRYRLLAVAASLAVETDVSGLRPGTAVTPSGVDAPQELLRLLDRWGPESVSAGPGERLQAMVDGMRADGYVSHGVDGEPVSRSGHALDRLVELAGAEPMIGDGEQYAVAAALLAREIGFPARVVVGYAGGERGVGGAVVFRGRDLSAWIEVQSADGDWVGIDPNPEARPIPEREPDQPNLVTRPESVLPPPPDDTPVDDLGGDADAGLDEPRERDPDWIGALRTGLVIAGFSLLGAALLSSPFLAIVVAKSRRRRLRRTAADAAERVSGGWDEFADLARDLGYRVDPRATRAEQAASIGGFGPLVLASVVDRIAFGPDGPSPGDADEVWATVGYFRRALRSSRSRLDRMRAAVSLTSLSAPAPGEPTVGVHDAAGERRSERV